MLSFGIPCRSTFLSSLLLQRQAFLQHTVSYHVFIVSPSSETGFLSAYRVVLRFYRLSFFRDRLSFSLPCRSTFFIVSPSSETGFLSAYRVIARFYRLSFFRDRLSFSIPCRTTFLWSLLLQRHDFFRHTVS